MKSHAFIVLFYLNDAADFIFECNTCHSKRTVGCPLKYLQQHNAMTHSRTRDWRYLTRLTKKK
jgi:hypothetical protein